MRPMSSTPRILLVANPTAQSGRNAERIASARSLLDAAGLPHTLLPTLPAGRTVGAVRDALLAGDWSTVIAMGGDGTFSEVARGLHASGRAEGVALGMLPTGTANDQGKSFGLSADPADLARNVAVLAAGHETRLDAGRLTALDAHGAVVEQALFFDSAGWGLSPRVLALRNEDRRVIEQMPVVREVFRDHLVYAGALLRTFAASYIEDDCFGASVSTEAGAARWDDLTDLVVKATRVYGGMWVFDPTSRHDDGLFEVVPFAGRLDWLSKGIVHLETTGALSSALEEVGVSHSRGLRAGAITLRFDARAGALPLAAQIDGEEFPATAMARIEVLPRALRLVIPAGA
jgi:diacylglycerol kinase family enzyme